VLNVLRKIVYFMLYLIYCQKNKKSKKLIKC